MSRESIDVVRRAHDALNAGDIDGLIALCDPGFRLDMSDRVFNPAVYDGHEGIRAFYAEVMEIWDAFTWEPVELREEAGLVIAILRSHGHARGSGVELDRRAAMVWCVDGVTARWMRFHRDPQEAEAAVRQAGAD